MDIEDKTKLHFSTLNVLCPYCETQMQGKVHKTAEAFTYTAEIQGGREPYFGLELQFLTFFQGKPVWALKGNFMKNREFTFYGTPLSFFAVIGIAMYSTFIGVVIYKLLLNEIDPTLNYRHTTGIIMGSIFILSILLFIRKKRIEITDTNIFKYYSGGKLVYTNTLDNLYYIQAVDIKRGMISEMKLCFPDRKIHFSMPALIPPFYGAGIYESMFYFFVKNLKLQKKDHHTIFGVSKYVFVYWNPIRKDNYQIYQETKGTKIL